MHVVQVVCFLCGPLVHHGRCGVVSCQSAGLARLCGALGDLLSLGLPRSSCGEAMHLARPPHDVRSRFVSSSRGSVRSGLVSLETPWAMLADRSSSCLESAESDGILAAGLDHAQKDRCLRPGVSIHSAHEAPMSRTELSSPKLDIGWHPCAWKRHST